MCNGLSASYFRRRAEEGNLLNYFCSVFAWGEESAKKVMYQAELKELLVQFIFGLQFPASSANAVCLNGWWTVINGLPWEKVRALKRGIWRWRARADSKWCIMANCPKWPVKGYCKAWTIKIIKSNWWPTKRRAGKSDFSSFPRGGKSPGRKLLETQISWWTYMQLQGANAINFLLSYREKGLSRLQKRTLIPLGNKLKGSFFLMVLGLLWITFFFWS